MTLTVEPPPLDALDAGVIVDARARQRRHRGLAAAIGLVALVVGIAVYFGLATGAGRSLSARLVVLTAAVKQDLSLAGDVRVTASLWPGAVGLCVGTADGVDSGTICDVPYPGPGIPVINSPGLPEWLAERPPPLGTEPIYLIAAPNVAAIRIANVTLTPHPHVGLPPGYTMLVVRIPTAPAGWPTRELRVTAFDRSGHILPFASSYLAPVQSSFKILALHSLAISAHTKCALTDTVTAYSGHPELEATRIVADPTAPQDSFFSCMDSGYVLTPYARDPVEFDAAILLSARHPGDRPGPLWGAAPVPGHTGLVEINSPPALANSRTQGSGSIIARRDGNTWLTAQTQSGHPTLAQRIQFITGLHLAVLDVDKP
jgi:hypothetical protein